MKDPRKNCEVQFYLDRTIDAAVMIMRSIVHNPTIAIEDQIEALRRIADFHGSIALDLEQCIHGKRVMLSLKQAQANEANLGK